jgi:hypothetical protein
MGLLWIVVAIVVVGLGLAFWPVRTVRTVRTVRARDERHERDEGRS